jgi:diguanylate cyclase (GGDEF)-like protein/PAS domain S-box-containing protein
MDDSVSMRLSQSRRVTAGILVATTLFGASAAAALLLVLPRSFRALEERETVAAVQRARESLEVALSNLSGRAGDWGGWDDTWYFIEGTNRSWITDNISARVYKELRIDLALVVDRAGRIVFAQILDPVTGALRPASARELPPLGPGTTLGSLDSEGARVTGIARTTSGPLLLAARPVLHTDGSGPIVGMLAFARRLDDGELASHARRTQLELDAYPYPAPKLPRPLANSLFTLDSGGALVRELDREHVAGYTLLSDIDGAPALVLRATAPRAIMARGREAAGWSVLALLSVTAVFAGVARRLGRRAVESLIARRDVENLHRAVLDQSGEGVVLVDAATRNILEVNAASTRILGEPAQSMLGRAFYDVVGRGFLELTQASGSLRREGGAMVSDVLHQRADGRSVDLELSLRTVRHEGRDLLCLGIRDVTERKAAEERARRLAWYDVPTGLPNRLLFQDRLGLALAHASRRGESVSVLFIDLDRFKEVNDRFGHDVGDRVLREIGRRIQLVVRNSDTVARQGGDDFLVLAPALQQPDGIGVMVSRLLRAVREPLEIGERVVQITASIGVASFPADARDSGALVRNAELACGQCKERGRDGWRVYDAAMQAGVTSFLELRAQLQEALENKEFRVFYQPQFAATEGKLVGFEALLRWDRPGEGLVPPGRFIPAAEDTGLIVPIGAWLLRAVCRQIREWRDVGLPVVPVGVNLSPRQLEEADVVEKFAGILQESGLPRGLVEFEVTERLAMQVPEEKRRVLLRLKELGATLALDDFGTGHSSLAYLRQFPFDRIKIDGAFVREIGAAPEQGELAAAIVGVGHSLRLRVVAECVETAEQLAALRAAGCDEVQGFGTGRPSPPEAARRWLEAELAPTLWRVAPVEEPAEA